MAAPTFGVATPVAGNGAGVERAQAAVTHTAHTQIKSDQRRRRSITPESLHHENAARWRRGEVYQRRGKRTSVAFGRLPAGYTLPPCLLLTVHHTAAT